MATQLLRDTWVLHVRFNGRSLNVPLSALDLTDASTDVQIKRRLAEYLQVPLRQLEPYVVDRHHNGSLTLRLQLPRA